MNTDMSVFMGTQPKLEHNIVSYTGRVSMYTDMSVFMVSMSVFMPPREARLTPE